MKQFFYIFALLLFSACSNHIIDDEPENIDSDEVKTISVMSHLPKSAGGVDTYADDAESGDNSQSSGASDNIIIDKFEEGSLLYISQMGPSINPNFSDFSTDAESYCYVYQYSENPSANWNYDYNFILPENDDFEIPGVVGEGSSGVRNPIKWNVIKQMGSVGNSFNFYAFFFPVENEVRWSVEEDQRGPETNRYDQTNFRKSDILGAYHTTSSLYSRLRFNLFHLMVYLKVTLYVPDVQDVADDTSNFKYSGFDETALQGAYVLNAAKDFEIEWRASRSSDTDPPLTQAKSNKTNIRMYLHEPDYKVFELENIKSSFNPSYQGEDTEQVREYNFSVLFPNQSFNGNFLCFALKDKEGNMRYFYFASNQINGSSGNYGFAPGTLQELKLFLPRETNQTILISANVLPWSSAVTDMTVSQQGATDKNDDNPTGSDNN
ncbi:MAG: hypothetical protein J1F20_00715 [Muribaculaceae bacterium]|nr:hypothetical protein [Muribaculaceae bacterium]